jgi:hypothetical protein
MPVHSEEGKKGTKLFMALLASPKDFTSWLIGGMIPFGSPSLVLVCEVLLRPAPARQCSPVQ